MHEDHKTYIPGVGFLVTSWDGSECHIFKTPLEEAMDEQEEVEEDFEDDGQPTEYEEWQDFYGGDDWDHGQYDEGF